MSLDTSHKVFVTGGTGLVGSHLLLSLAQSGQKIVALKRATSDLSYVRKLFDRANAKDLFHGIEWAIGDINDVTVLEEAIQGCKDVYHTAACVSFDPRDKEKLFKINIEGTANVVNACLDEGVNRNCAT